ncbi:MAG TPA: acetoacetate decarboxylase family protein [Deltaproteobacteria bacterium]|nr:acetoacetate decarboxylase family protein [Deltaproteobacteria bacterium]HPP80104.1 acetoacetate decarboxylase family protein [Deltaproteobacteria bacterium]
MGFVKTFNEIMANTRSTADFYDAEMLTVFWETKPEIVARLLPPPLKPAAMPIAMAFVAWYPATNFDVTYHESALFVRARYNGEEGGYCLSMPVTNDMAMAGGREIYGYPKKIGDIHFKRTGGEVHGWTERRGIRFMEVKARLTGRCNDEEFKKVLDALYDADGSMKAVAFNFKSFPAPEGGAFDYNPRLVRQETLFKPKERAFGEAEIILRDSAYDPWSEVEIVRMLGAMYTRGDNSMLGGKVVAELDLMQFAPYAFLKWDMK